MKISDKPFKNPKFKKKLKKLLLKTIMGFILQ